MNKRVVSILPLISNKLLWTMRQTGTPNKRTTLGERLIGPHLEEVIAFLAAVAKGRPQDDPKNKGAVDVVTAFGYDTKERTDAAKTLLAYGLSKPATAVAVNGGVDEEGNDVPLGIAVKFIKP